MKKSLWISVLSGTKIVTLLRKSRNHYLIRRVHVVGSIPTAFSCKFTAGIKNYPTEYNEKFIKMISLHIMELSRGFLKFRVLTKV